MAEKIIKGNLGVDAHKLDKTSIEFFDINSKLLNDIDNFVIEGEEGQVNIIKDSGKLRPHLVLNLRELHSKVALYMTASATDEKISVSNSVRGEHLFRSPYMLYNYINSSTVKGVGGDRLSAIDRDKIMFVTQDSFLDLNSRALNINQLDLNMNRHIYNAKMVEDLLKNDLRESVFTHMVRSGKFELWYYDRFTHNIHLYNPSANYLKLFLNAVIAFDNEKKNFPPEVLELMSEVGSTSAKAYQNFVNYERKIEKLRISNEKLYQAYRNARFYSNVLTPTGLNNLEKLTSSENEYSKIYGDPIDYSNLSVKDRLEVEFNRIQLKGKRREEAQVLLNGLLKEERNVTAELKGAVGDVIEFLQFADEYERIDLSKFPYKEVFWNSFYDHSKVNEYGELLARDLNVKYSSLSREYSKHKLQQEIEREKRERGEKALKREAENIKKQYQKRLEQGLDFLVNHHLAQYGKAFNLYDKGRLELSKDDYAVLFSEIKYPRHQDIEFGKNTAKKLINELKAQDKMRPAFLTIEKQMNFGKDSVKKMQEGEDASNLAELMRMATRVEDKVNRANKGKDISEKFKQREVKRIIAENFVHDEENTRELLETMIDPDFNFGKNSEEMLISMQDVFNAKTTLTAQASIRANKLAVLQAVVDLNNPELLSGYQEARTAIDELIEDGFVLPPNITIKNLDQIGEEIDGFIANLGGKNLTKDAYLKLLQEVETKKSTIKHFVSQTAKLQQTRREYLTALASYENKVEEEREVASKIVPIALEEFNKKIHEEFESPESAGFRKTENGKWAKEGLNGELIEEVSDEVIQNAFNTYIETNKPSLNPENYSNRDVDMILVNDLFNKAFPPKEVLLTETRQQMKSANSLEEVIKRYKKAQAKLTTLTKQSDFKDFVNMVAEEYAKNLAASEGLLKVTSGTIYEFKYMVEGLFEQIAEGQLEDVEGQDEVVKIIQDIKEKRAERELEDHNETMIKLRERIGDIVKAMPYRTEEEMGAYLSKSALKSAVESGVSLPKAIMGENGINKYLDDYHELQSVKLGVFYKQTIIEDKKFKIKFIQERVYELQGDNLDISEELDEIISKQSVKKSASEDEAEIKRLQEMDEETKRIEAEMKRLTDSSGDLIAVIKKEQKELDEYAGKNIQKIVYNENFNYVRREMKPRIERLQKPLMDKLILDISETARLWMNESDEYRDFVKDNSKLYQTLKATLKKNVHKKVYSPLDKGIWCSTPEDEKGFVSEDYDYISFYKVLYQNINKIIDAYSKNTPIEGGELDDYFYSLLDCVYEAWSGVVGGFKGKVNLKPVNQGQVKVNTKKLQNLLDSAGNLSKEKVDKMFAEFPKFINFGEDE